MTSPTTDTFRHEALFYDTPAEFVSGCLDFIHEGLAQDESILVVVPGHKIAWLKDALGEKRTHVHFADMAEVGSNPARIIPAWAEFIEEQTALGRSFRGIGEPVYPERSDAEISECRRHEALLNVAFEGSGAWRLLCPYDTVSLSSDVIEEARRTHPYLVEDGAMTVSDLYPGTHRHAAPFDEILPEPDALASSLTFGTDDLVSVREFVTKGAQDAGLDLMSQDALVLAVNEVATNSIRHGGGGGSLRMWVSGSALICEIDDSGVIFDPLVGRNIPTLSSTGGRGLWMVNQLCDLVQQRTTDTGTVTRMHFLLRS